LCASERLLKGTDRAYVAARGKMCARGRVLSSNKPYEAIIRMLTLVHKKCKAVTNMGNCKI